MMYINRNDKGSLMTKHDASKCYKVLSYSLFPYDYDIFISRNQNRYQSYNTTDSFIIFNSFIWGHIFFEYKLI